MTQKVLKSSRYDSFRGSFKVHITGIPGGMIWCIGMSFSIIAAILAGFSNFYDPGQGAIMVAAFFLGGVYGRNLKFSGRHPSPDCRYFHIVYYRVVSYCIRGDLMVTIT